MAKVSGKIGITLSNSESTSETMLNRQPPPKPAKPASIIQDDYASIDYDTILDVVMPTDALETTNQLSKSINILALNNPSFDGQSSENVFRLFTSFKAEDVALSLTVEDLVLFKISGSPELGLMVKSGLELVTLPQGEKLRNVIIERVCVLELFVLLSIFLLPKDEDQLSSVSQWVKIVDHLQSVEKNWMSFCAIMHALLSKYVQNHEVWSNFKSKNVIIYQRFINKLVGIYNDLINDFETNLESTVPVLWGPLLFSKSLLSLSPDFGLARFRSLDVDQALNMLNGYRNVLMNIERFDQKGSAMIRRSRKDEILQEFVSPTFQARFIWGQDFESTAPSELYQRAFIKLSELCFS